MLVAVLIFLLVLFAFTDVWYFVRGAVLYLMVRLTRNTLSLTEEQLLKPFVTWSMVLPSDLDLNLHMNNAKYLRDCDFGRVGLWLAYGMGEVLGRHNGYIVVSASSMRYRKAMFLFQAYQIQTRILCWDNDAMYLEQRMITRAGFIAAILVVKMAVRGVKVQTLVSEMCGGRPFPSPKPSLDVRSWMDSIMLSSKKLKDELAQKPSGIPVVNKQIKR